MCISDEERDSLDNNGYLRVPGVLKSDLLNGVISAIGERFGLFVDRPESWSRMPHANYGMVPMHHHQALWNLRQDPDLFAFFERLFGTSHLAVSVDRASFHPPHSVIQWEGAHHDLHWDFNPGEDHREIQGLVYLTDTPEERGAFRCAPQLFANRNDFPSFDPLTEPYPIDLADVPTVAVPGRAGDLILWKPQLPHCAGPNLSSKPRLAQCVTMIPGLSQTERREWGSWVSDLRPQPWWRGLEGQVDPERGPKPKLTALGRRLACLDDWPDSTN